MSGETRTCVAARSPQIADSPSFESHRHSVRYLSSSSDRAESNFLLGHAVLMWLLPFRHQGRLGRFKHGCARAALIGPWIALAFGLERGDRSASENALFGLAVVAGGALSGGILSLLWRPRWATDS